MTLFALVNGDKVKPTGKVVPAEAFSRLVEGEQIVEQIRQEAEEYRQQVALEGEKLKEEAEKAGFDAGLERWSKQLAHLEEEIANLRREYHALIVPVAIEAAKRVVGRELETNEETIADIVANHLRTVAQHKRVVVYCNKADLEALEKHKEKLKRLFERLESLSIQERDDVEENGCIIETEAGIMNAGWDQQWKALEGALERIADRL